MRVAIAIAVSAALLGGCMLDPKAPRQDPRYPRQSGELKPIDPYKTDKIPDTAYEVWKRDKERNDKIAGEDGDSYPSRFKGQKADSEGSSQ
jgi:hypothetical protein